MRRLPIGLEPLDERLTGWMARHGVTILRVGLGIVFVWFGALKLFPGASPAEALAGRTIETLTGGLIAPSVGLPILALWECAIGLGLVTGRALRTTLLLLFLQMPGTALPIVLFPGEVFVHAPFVLTLEGQYIVKNLVLIGGALVIGATVRGGGLEARPHRMAGVLRSRPKG